MTRADLTLDLGLLGDVDAVVEFNYGRAEPENGVPEDFEILSVVVSYMEFGRRVTWNIAPMMPDACEKQIIKQIREG